MPNHDASPIRLLHLSDIPTISPGCIAPTAASTCWVQDAQQSQFVTLSQVYCPAPPGAGKSTFCRWVALQSIPGSAPAHPVPPPDGFAEPPPANLRTRLPLLLSGLADALPTWERAGNRTLLTALCAIYGNGRRLPQDRYHLYQKIINIVLYNRYPGDARQREPVKARLEAIAYGMHTGADRTKTGRPRAPRPAIPKIELLASARPSGQNHPNA